MKSAAEIKSLITNFISEDLMVESVNELSSEGNLFVEGHIDSMGIMKLIAHIESNLQIKIPPKDLVPKNFMTIQAMIDYLTLQQNLTP